MRKLLIGFATFALAIATAAPSTYKINLLQPSVINGTELKAGEYKIEVNDNKAIVNKGNKTVAECNVKVETSDSKYSTTTIRYSEGQSGKLKVQEILLGGTNTKLVFND